MTSPNLQNRSIWLLLTGALLSLLLGYFAIENYRSSLPVAAGSLRGLALSLSSTIESLAGKDPSLMLLRDLQSPDIAFYSISGTDGILLFHTNPDLIGSQEGVNKGTPYPSLKGYSEQRIELGTGEVAFEFIGPLHLSDKTLNLRLVLHTYRADEIVHQAQAAMTVILSFIVAGWVMGLFLYRFAVRAERHREQMAEKETLARLGTLGAVLAHEVRNPLSGIKGYAQLLEERLEEAESREYAVHIVTEAVRLEMLVNDLLLFARNDPPELSAVAVAEIISHSAKLLESFALSCGIEIKLRLDETLTAIANRDRLEQVILNILQNAIQAMPEGGQVVIEAW